MTIAAREIRWEHAICVTFAELRDSGAQIATETEARIRRRYPAYSVVSPEALRASCLHNVELGYRVMSERRRATAEEIAARSVVGADRAREGVPVDDMLSAWSLTMGVIRDRFLEVATQCHARPDSILEATQLLWALAEDITGHLAAAHRDTEMALARDDDLQRKEFLHQLLLGSASGCEINRRASTYGLQGSAQYHAIRARGVLTDDPHVATGLRKAVERCADDVHGKGLVGVIDGDVVGVLARIPEIREPAAVIAVGPPAHLAAMDSSYAVASRILDVGVRFSMTGTRTLLDIATQAAVVDEPEIGDLLIERYLKPLSTVPDLRALLGETLRVFMANGLSLKQAGRVLRIHPNTVRYRLRRFEELTGVDLSNTEVLFRVWWALERARILKESTVTGGLPARPPAGPPEPATGSRLAIVGSVEQHRSVTPDAGDRGSPR